MKTRNNSQDKKDPSITEKLSQSLSNTAKHMGNRFRGLKMAGQLALSAATKSRSPWPIAADDKSTTSSDLAVSREGIFMILSKFASAKRLGRLGRVVLWEGVHGQVKYNGSNIIKKLNMLQEYASQKQIPDPESDDGFFQQLFSRKNQPTCPVPQAELKNILILLLANILTPQSFTEVDATLLHTLSVAAVKWDLDNPRSIIRSFPQEFYVQVAGFDGAKEEVQSILQLCFIIGLQSQTYSLQMKNNSFLLSLVDRLSSFMFDKPEAFYRYIQDLTSGENIAKVLRSEELGLYRLFMANIFPADPNQSLESSQQKMAEFISVLLATPARLVHSEYGSAEKRQLVEKDLQDMLVNLHPLFEQVHAMTDDLAAIEKMLFGIARHAGQYDELRGYGESLIEISANVGFDSFTNKLLQQSDDAQTQEIKSWFHDEVAPVIGQFYNHLFEPDTLDNIQQSLSAAKSAEQIQSLAGMKDDVEHSHMALIGEGLKIAHPIIHSPIGDNLQLLLVKIAAAPGYSSTLISQSILSRLQPSILAEGSDTLTQGESDRTSQQSSASHAIQQELQQLLETPNAQNMLMTLIIKARIALDDNTPLSEKLEALAPMMDFAEDLALSCPELCNMVLNSPELQKTVGELFLSNMIGTGYYCQSAQEVGAELMKSLIRDLRAHQGKDSHRMSQIFSRLLHKPSMSNVLSWLASPSVFFQYRLPYLPLILTGRSLQHQICAASSWLYRKLKSFASSIAQTVSELCQRTANMYRTTKMSSWDNEYSQDDPPKEYQSIPPLLLSQAGLIGSTQPKAQPK